MGFFDDDDPDDPIYGYDRTAGDEFLRLSNPIHVEHAWREVQSELDPGWTVAGTQRSGSRPGGWIATATGPHKGGAVGYGESPALALMDLRDAVRAQRSEAHKKKLPPPW